MDQYFSDMQYPVRNDLMFTCYEGNNMVNNNNNNTYCITGNGLPDVLEERDGGVFTRVTTRQR